MTSKHITCPVCHKAPDPAHRPFCSRRCADIDLGRWLNASYTLPIQPDEDDESQGEE